MRKWVPCSHTSCTAGEENSKAPHLVAIAALCLHFFPEAAVREVLLEDLSGKTAFVGAIGFIAHFFVDIIVPLLIVSYWRTRLYQVLTVLFISATWVVSFNLGNEFFQTIPENIQGFIFIIGEFFLAMFVHLPHKPALVCKKNH